jgi:CRISPR system Cascade subunit CasD
MPMDTLLIRLTGPLQSWGVQSPFENRDTGREPSKSGVVGLLCAALGRPRAAPLDDLAQLRMGVRADVEGRLEQDYQTIAPVTAQGIRLDDKTKISHRMYLSDAAFLVGLEGQPRLLAALQDALRQPVWALCLGRKAFAPALPVWLTDGIRQGVGLEDALHAYPWLPDGGDVPFPASKKRPERLRLILEDAQGPQSRQDQPISFAERLFAPRWVRTDFCDVPQPAQEAPCTSPA